MSALATVLFYYGQVRAISGEALGINPPSKEASQQAAFEEYRSRFLAHSLQTIAERS